MIRFKTSHRWEEAEVASRVATIVGGEASDDDLSPPWSRDGKWQLDVANNWFLSRVGDYEYELRYRYTHHQVQVALDHLASFLEWIFGR